VNYYEILGLPRDASPEEVGYAYSAKMARLLPARAAGAPPHVIEAVDKARVVVGDAGRILGDGALRAQYDFAIDRADDRGAVDPEFGSSSDDDKTDDGLGGAPMTSVHEWFESPLADPLNGLEALAEWLAPRQRESRMVTVPDFLGVEASEAFYGVARADLHINFVHLSTSQEGDGLVVNQDPPAGTSVRRHSTVTVEVVYSGAPT
jgi:curved DNA-binding protein CbpA